MCLCFKYCWSSQKRASKKINFRHACPTNAYCSDEMRKVRCRGRARWLFHTRTPILIKGNRKREERNRKQHHSYWSKGHVTFRFVLRLSCYLQKATFCSPVQKCITAHVETLFTGFHQLLYVRDCILFPNGMLVELLRRHCSSSCSSYYSYGSYSTVPHTITSFQSPWGVKEKG